MSEHAAQVTVQSGRRHRAHASDSLRLPPAVTVSALTGAAVGGGWILDNLDVLPTPVGIVAAGAATGGLLWWTAVRSFSARKGVARAEQIRAERDDALRALGDVIASAEKGRQDVRWAADQVQQGGAHTNFQPSVARPHTGDVCVDALNLVEHAFAESWQAVMAAATHQHRKLNAEAELAEIFKSIAPRLQSLVNRSISVISEVERNIEDPELMAELFRVDHLLTQIRRAVESLAVLGGNAPSRDSAPVLVATAIRRAVAEIPEYQRVRVALAQQTATLPGYVSPNVVHLLAALMENATDFSSDKVEVFTHQAGRGIAIELLDRGTGMSQQKREALNRLLAAPEGEDPRVRLREGKIGLLVAALLAKRHKITIELGPNIIGGTQAVVVIPPDLLVTPYVESANTHAGERSRTSSPSGPVRQVHPAPHLEDTTELPRRVRPALPAAVLLEDPPIQDGSRPPLPRRGQAERRVPPPQQAPAGTATSGLMANFRSRRPSAEEQVSQPPGG
ncbi:ATP-binding protein [Streptomyces sp. NBC_01527]|uniref:hypothetical protein n=1 Tax=Streptomyces sp. NBC_01527 TaxID=2903894 RepID=UPI00386EFE02